MDRSAGFTLLEVLVALTVLSVLLTATYATFSATTQQIELARQDAEFVQTARVILDRMFMDLSCCARIEKSGTTANTSDDQTVSVPFVCSGRLNERQSFSVLSFSSYAHLAMTAGTMGLDATRMEYRLIENQEEGGLELLRADNPYPGHSSGDDRFLVLGRRIKDFELVFFDSNKKASVSWNSAEGPQKGTLPRRIQVRFTLMGKDGYEYPFTTSWTLPPYSG